MHVGKDEWWYLASQGPLPNTVVDFWQMVWEQEVEVVAMLTGLLEQGRPKCARYWPENIGTKNKKKFGEVSVPRYDSLNVSYPQYIQDRYLNTVVSIILHVVFVTVRGVNEVL